MRKRFYTQLLYLLFLPLVAFGQPQDVVQDLSGLKWKIWLDKEAGWENDELFLPPVDISSIPLNPPTCGWDKLLDGRGKTVSLPATVEEHFWGENGNSFGVAGNYTGVSWFFTTFEIDEALSNNRVLLDFESVRLRAEVYLNGVLVGYDLINGTPFQVDISESAKYGETNQLAIRITDPNGNFAWRDWETYKWGKYDIPPSHGFGGITGRVQLRSTGKTFIKDVFVKNSPNPKEINVNVDLSEGAQGQLALTVRKWGDDEVLYTTAEQAVYGVQSVVNIVVPEALLWTPDTPNLYLLEVKYKGNKGDQHVFTRRFGFRWFEVKEVAGDRMFFLNGKRIMARTAISWGHWPVNGIYPTDELAKKHVQAAKDLGLNMLNFHRGIGQTSVLNYADELGLLYYAEPGGYRPGDEEFTRIWNREKMTRMITRFRSHPSLVIYNMINEAAREPYPVNVSDIKLFHKLDESRIITYTTTYFPKKLYGGIVPLDTASIKMHMLPYSHDVLNYGWLDKHQAGGPGVYKDEFYNSSEDMRRGEFDKQVGEIVFWGEDGAIGAPHRLGLVKEAIESAGNTGWDGESYLKQYKAFDDFLTNKDFRGAFPTVDDLCEELGKNAHYYQARIIENVRCGNTTDGYVVNGWEGEKIENHSGVVDIFRNPKTDAGYMSYYNQPLYVAVKLRNKVVSSGGESVADFYIINEENVAGVYTLEILVKHNEQVVLKKRHKVSISGGDRYGELLLENFKVPVVNEGYTIVQASIKKGAKVLAKGTDEVFAVALNREMLPVVSVKDSSGLTQRMLEAVGVTHSDEPGNKIPSNKVLFVGETIQPGFFNTDFRMNDPLLDWVANGNTLVITQGADVWAEYLNLKEVVDYRGAKQIGRNWFGGNYFVKSHPVFKDLPVDCSFTWEYQALAGYDMKRIGLRLEDEQCVVGVYADHNHEVYTAMGIIPLGKGKIILSAIDLQKAIERNNQASVVAKKILQNIVDFAQ